jgi:putative DNA-invertase from lambdoid prophage Rac
VYKINQENGFRRQRVVRGVIMSNLKKSRSRVVGYCRVSTVCQKSQRQFSDIAEYCEKNKLGAVEFVSEKISARKNERLIFGVIDELNAGDILVVTELSRLGRSMSDVNYITGKAFKQGVEIRVIVNDIIIDNSIQSQAMVFALNIGAQIERDLISERTKSALREKQKQGVILGRPKGKSVLDGKKEQIQELAKIGLSNCKIARCLGVHRHTLTNYLKQSKLKI